MANDSGLRILEGSSKIDKYNEFKRISQEQAKKEKQHVFWGELCEDHKLNWRYTRNNRCVMCVKNLNSNLSARRLSQSNMKLRIDRKIAEMQTLRELESFQL